MIKLFSHVRNEKASQASARHKRYYHHHTVQRLAMPLKLARLFLAGYMIPIRTLYNTQQIIIELKTHTRQAAACVYCLYAYNHFQIKRPLACKPLNTTQNIYLFREKLHKCLVARLALSRLRLSNASSAFT